MRRRPCRRRSLRARTSVRLCGNAARSARSPHAASLSATCERTCGHWQHACRDDLQRLSRVHRSRWSPLLCPAPRVPSPCRGDSGAFRLTEGQGALGRRTLVVALGLGKRGSRVMRRINGWLTVFWVAIVLPSPIRSAGCRASPTLPALVVGVGTRTLGHPRSRSRRSTPTTRGRGNANTDPGRGTHHRKARRNDGTSW